MFTITTHAANGRNNIVRIESDLRVRFTQLGTGGKGIVWDVAPGNFDSAIDLVNNNGGRDLWRIEALAS